MAEVPGVASTIPGVGGEICWMIILWQDACLLERYENDMYDLDLAYCTRDIKGLLTYLW